MAPAGAALASPEPLADPPRAPNNAGPPAKQAALDNRPPIGDAQASPMFGTPSFADFDAVLTRLHAKLPARQAHALYLGALTSTNVRLGPQRLLDRLLGDAPALGDSIEAANAVIQILFGYWNTLVADRDQGRVRLAPCQMPEQPTPHDLRAFASQRHDEILWFIRGIDAGGDDPIEFGPEGQKLLEQIAEASGFLNAYVEMLGRDTPVSPEQIQQTRAQMLQMDTTIEQLIADLMSISNAVRLEALETFAANAGQPTDDGAKIARPVKVGRNALCPCRSGKKYKKCCGGPSTVQ